MLNSEQTSCMYKYWYTNKNKEGLQKRKKGWKPWHVLLHHNKPQISQRKQKTQDIWANHAVLFGKQTHQYMLLFFIWKLTLKKIATKWKLKLDSSFSPLQRVAFSISAERNLWPNRAWCGEVTRLVSSQSPLWHLHACRVGWSFPSPWRVAYGDAYNRDAARGPRSSTGWSRNHRECTWNRLYGMTYHRPPPENATVSV